jgi:hypothetical protein
MFRKLLILGAIAALFTIVTAVPASAITIDTGQGDKQVLSPFNADGTASDAHGPFCGTVEGDPVKECPNNKSPVGALYPGGLSNPMGGVNLGAWNGVFQSNSNSAIFSP